MPVADSTRRCLLLPGHTHGTDVFPARSLPSALIHTHRGGIFVVSSSGEALADVLFTNLVDDFALLNSLKVGSGCYMEPARREGIAHHRVLNQGMHV